MKESIFQSRLLKIIRPWSLSVLNVHGHAMQASGWPDLYIVSNWWSGWLELKVGNNWLSPVQRVVAGKLATARVNCLVMRAEENGGRWDYVLYDQCKRQRGDVTEDYYNADGRGILNALAAGCHD